MAGGEQPFSIDANETIFVEAGEHMDSFASRKAG